MALALDQDMGRSFELLNEEECLALLAQGWLGRVVVSKGDVPAVFPVNFLSQDGAIYFLTGAGTKLSAALRSTVVAFEVDHVDTTYRHGWSVQAIGVATVVEDESIRRAIGNRLAPWAPGRRDRLVRIWPASVTGRRIGFAAHTTVHASARRQPAEPLPEWSDVAHAWADAGGRRGGVPMTEETDETDTPDTRDTPDEAEVAKADDGAFEDVEHELSASDREVSAFDPVADLEAFREKIRQSHWALPHRPERHR